MNELARSRLRRYGYVAVVMLVILLFGCIRHRVRNIPLERDEGEYAYAGQLILHGIPPYQLAYNMKLPGTYVAYAAILAIFGQTPAGVHLGLLLVNAVTILLLYLLAGRLFGRMAGMAAAASYAVLSAGPSVSGLAGHATNFVVLSAVAGLLLLLTALDSNRTSFVFLSGVLLGVAFLMKQPGILFTAFGGFYLLYRECKPWPPKWANVVIRAGAYFVGAMIPFALVCLYLSAAGVFSRFWFWTFTYAREYGSIVNIAEGGRRFRENFPDVVGPASLIWVLAVVGLTTLLWDRVVRAHAFFVIGFLVFSAAAICPGLYFRDHYFILLLPVISVLVGAAVSTAKRRLLAAGWSRIVAAVPLGLFLFVVGYTIFLQRMVFFKTDPLMACRDIYGGNPFPEAVKVGEYIRAHSAPEDRIAVLGSEPEIYFYSDRRSATGYIYTYGLMENQKFALLMQRDMIAEIEAARPEYMVLVTVPLSWLRQPGSPGLILNWGGDYLQRQFELVGVADQQPQYVWGEAAKHYSPRSPYAVYVFKRKSHG